MSVDVLREVFKHSRSKGVARNVLTVLADAAHPDGVTWLPIVPSKDGDPSRCITHRANASRRAVIDAIASLEELDEIEVRTAQRGRRRFNVYRVRLGSVALSAVDYADLPFRLDRPFADGVQIPHLVTGDDGVQFSDDEVQFSSPRGADFVSGDGAETGEHAGDSGGLAAPEASVEPSGEAAADQDLHGRTVSGDVGLEDPAAATAAQDRPARDDEIVAAVRSFPDSDPGSPAVVRRFVGNLPVSVFASAVDRARRRRGGIGLLVTFLRIAQAEQAAAWSAQLAEQLGQRVPVRVPPPFAIDVLKRENPERYVRLMAKSVRDADLVEVLAEFHDQARVEALVELACRVRDGDVEADRVGSPRDEYARWVEDKATDPAFPLAEIATVIDGSGSHLDDVDRQELHELAAATRERIMGDDERSEAA